jgi:cell division protein FtsQ
VRAKSNRRKALKKAIRWPRINFKELLLGPALLAGGSSVLVGIGALLNQPLSRLVVEGTFQRVTPMQLEAALGGELKRGFLSVDLNEVRRRIESLDWVDVAEVGRLWPDTLFVRVSEHRAAARWGRRGLLDVTGELFTEDARHAYPELPQLDGPKGSERQVAEVYLAIRGRLIEAGMGLASLGMDERGAWHLRLQSGQDVRLGRRDVKARLDRFFGVVAPALSRDFERVAYVDLRYTNGFAVGWAAAPDGTDADGRELLSSG